MRTVYERVMGFAVDTPELRFGYVVCVCVATKRPWKEFVGHGSLASGNEVHSACRVGPVDRIARPKHSQGVESGSEIFRDTES